MPRLATSSVLAPKLGKLHSQFPEILLDVTTDARHRDIVVEGFEAGIHFGEYIEKDMIAVRVSRDHRPAIVASPDYFKSNSKPKEPRDLLQHRCINFRHEAEGLYRWEFGKGKQELSVAVSGSLVVDDLALVIQGALQGVGLAFVAEHEVIPISKMANSCAFFRTGANPIQDSSSTIRVDGSRLLRSPHS